LILRSEILIPDRLLEKAWWNELERSAEPFREEVKTIQVFELKRPQKSAGRRRLFGYP